MVRRGRVLALANRPGRRDFAPQRPWNFRGGRRGFGDEDFHGPARLAENRFPVCRGARAFPPRVGDDVVARPALNL